MIETGRASAKPWSGTFVVHRAALGDFILIWPWLRRWSPCTVVTDGSKARLVRRFLKDVRAIDIESSFWNALWIEGADPPVHHGVGRVVCYVGSADSTWARNAARAFPNAAIEFRSTRPPDRLESPRWQPEARSNPTGPIVFHVGAGSPDKRWPIARSIELIKRRPGLLPIFGEVEAERLSGDELRALEAVGGRQLDTLDQLAATLESAKAFVGFDSGPTHLAAQLGLPTIALFGPTDPARWSPIGPCVRVIAPPSPRAMNWLDAKVVAERLAPLGE